MCGVEIYCTIVCDCLIVLIDILQFPTFWHKVILLNFAILTFM